MAGNLQNDQTISAILANVTDFRGNCPVPFLDQEKFLPHKRGQTGHIEGRLCAPVPTLPGRPICCLPCPATDWLYPDDFKTIYKIAESISAFGLLICCFLLLSFAFLPVDKTRRHWLSICLVIGIVMEALAFVVPLGVKPNQCFDQITPNDMYTSMTCAFSGAFIVGGGLVVSVWIFMRSLSMHLQICWDIVPGNWFFYAAQACGWLVAATLFTLTMTLTGVSFRFGDTCHVNTEHSMATFWGPLLGIASFTGLIQVLTFLYCIKVYLRSLWSDNHSGTNGSSGLPSYHSTMGGTSARAVYQRMKKVLWLQWRSITIVVFLLVDIIFLAVVWVQLNNTLEEAKKGKMEHFMPFLFCLVSKKGEKKTCYAAGQKAIINEGTAIAILMLLALTGVQTGLLMARTSMFVAWYELFKKTFGSKREFVSLDAKRYSHAEQRNYELHKVTSSPGIPQTPEAGEVHTEIFTSKQDGLPPQSGYRSPEELDRAYHQPTMSFSGPQAPLSRQGHRNDWNQEETHATGGLGSHPLRSPPNTSRLPSRPL
ncbi:hypothetical protein EJ08DRAFT_148057 [Tothia fuscella]|uniref:G-protein coupled receptors family 2 profile 2 domain-containing protein n=1 Tax=Tothia fuscella TaxID=1048955 RepID=A0A9P4U407_9PEZI|nr:hypothetical protein EJ08DRAFT_148057 [Tothia fuscella]